MFMKNKFIKKVCISILFVIIGAIFGAYIVGKNILKRLDKIRMNSEKYLALFLLMIQWFKTKQKGKSVSAFLNEEGIKNIAIYGMGYTGEILIEELKNTGINVLYGIDRNASSITSSVDVVSINDNFKTVDAIIVTAITFFDEIYKELSPKVDCPIISLEDIIYIL